MPIIISSGSYFLFFCLALNVVTLMVPYWWIDEDNYGLWGTCKCIWNYNVGDTHSKAWFRAAQWLYAAATALMAVVLFVLFIASCCTEKSYAKVMTASGAVMLICALLVGVSVAVFGYKAHYDEDWKLELSGTRRYDWGMWLGVGGFGVALATAIVFIRQSSAMYEIKED